MANPESEQEHDTVPPILPLETNLASSSGSDNASQDEEDDGQALLPRHTKVTVTGNNRTKQSLVGLTGVVRKAVGLGGWHWLVSLPDFDVHGTPSCLLEGALLLGLWA
jgi:hypothetical protein